MRIALLPVVFTFLSVSSLHGQHAFNWLVGTWKLNGEETYERWDAGSDGDLYGRSFSVNGSDTVMLEKIRITYSEGFYHYIPDVPENKAPVDFKISTWTASGFVAENPEHDFPKKIRYTIVRKPDGDVIEAAIEGNGKVIPYTFQRHR